MFKDRYFPSAQIEQWLSTRSVKSEVIGRSELGKPIYAVQLGKGPVKILIWSQMHGNESTTTRALLLWLDRYLKTKHFQKTLSLLIIPQLNPDGADRYTRQNANGIDLNRDAQNQTQSEIKALMQLVENFQPQYNLNLHDQRTRYTVGDTDKEAVISFLSASADESRSIISTRLIAMQLINHMVASLSDDFKIHIGRYDDAFNSNCTGDFFHTMGIPTVLFEAGQLGTDYSRNYTVEIIAKCLANLFNYLSKPLDLKSADVIYQEYSRIPENTSNSYDELVISEKHQFYVRYLEELVDFQIDKRLEFSPCNTADLRNVHFRQLLDYRQATPQQQQRIDLRVTEYLHLNNS